MDIYLLNFNNYYNRQVKLYGLLSNYIQFLCKGNTYGNNPINGVNFNPGNGIDSTQVINWDGENPDYIIAADGNEIISRWYVIQSERLRNGQFRLVLYRDLIADYYEEVMTAPMFIEKGFTNYKNPIFYTKEGIQCSQIKQKETLLKDNTGCAWVVGYLSPEARGKTVNYGSIPIPDIEVEELNEWDYYNVYRQGTTTARNITHNIKTQVIREVGFTLYYLLTTSMEYGKSTIVSETYSPIPSDSVSILGNYNLERYEELLGFLKQITVSSNADVIARNQFGYPNNSAEIETNIRNLNGKILKIKNQGKYFKIMVKQTVSNVEYVIDKNTNLFNYYKNIVDYEIPDPSKGNFNTIVEAVEWDIELLEVTSTSGLNFAIRNDMNVLNDAPYAMFCIPYGEYSYINSEQTTINTIPTNAISLGSGIATSLGGVSGSSFIYDLQLLPYCPISYLRDNGNSIDLTSISDSLQYQELEEANQIIFYARESSGSFDITRNYYIEDELKCKIDNECLFMRLCSPNYGSIFEFNPTKNLGINYINVDYCYKPHQPYIHLNPNFKGFYGEDFNDPRGLVCGGDFSLPVLEDAWVDYQINNKNFNDIFARQIKSLELKHDIASTMDIVNAITGTVTGGVTGATAGAMSGGGWGALAGGIVGTAASGVAGGFDIYYNQKLREDELSAAKDIRAYQLGNVQAIPDALSRVSAYNPNNKIFPILELYDAPKEERKVVERKLIYNGFTLNIIGTLEEIITFKPRQIEWGFYKGRILRLEGISDDFRIAAAIAEELNKGVYII